MYKNKGTARPQRPKPPKKAAARRSAPQEGGPLAVGQRVRVVRDGKVCDGDVSFLSPLRDTCTITYVDKTVETFVSVKRLRSASKDGGFAVLAAPPTNNAPAPKAKPAKSLLRFKRGDRVEVRRGKTWAKRTVRSCEATGPGTADLTLADPWGNEEFHQLDASEGLDDVIRWEQRPRGASLDTPPAPAPKAKAPQPKSPAPKAAAVKQLHNVVSRQASAESERLESNQPAWARRGATCQVDCGHDWFDCTLTTREKQGTWRIRHADGAFENGVSFDRLRERQWFAAGSLARVAYQDRWHDCKILAVSRDRKTCTVRYEDNGYAEENVPVATRLRELRYADPVAPVPLPDFSKPAPKPVSLASSSDRDSPATAPSKKKKTVPPPPPRFVEPGPSVVKPKAKPLRAKPDIDLTGDDDESPRKAPKPKQKPAAPHPPSKPKPEKVAPKPKPAPKAAKSPPTVAAAKEKAQPKPKPVPKAKPEAAAAPKAPKAPKAQPKVAKAPPTVEAAKEKVAPKPKPAPKARPDAPSKAPKAKPAPKAKKPEVAAAPAPKPSPVKKAAPAPPKAKAAPKPQKKAEAPTRESPKKAKAPAPKRPSPEKAEAPPKPEAEAAPRQPKRPSFFPKPDAAAPAPQPSPKKTAPTPPQEASPKPAAASPKPEKPQTPPKPTPAGPQNTPAGPQTTPAAPATLTPNQSRSHEQALETLKLAANPDLEPLPPRRRPSAPKPPTPVAPKEPEASPTPVAAAPTPPSPEPATQKQQAEPAAAAAPTPPAPEPERPPTPPPPAKDATAASPKRERRLGPGTTLTPRRKSSIDEPVGRGALGRKVQKFETGPPPATPAPQPTSPSSTTPVLLHYKSGADVTSNEMDLTDKWLGKPVAALKAAFAKRMSLDVDGLSTKRADGTTISEALPIRDIIDGVEGSANVVFELKASE